MGLENNISTRKFEKLKSIESKTSIEKLYILPGNIDAYKLNSIIENFIQKIVICPECTSIETGFVSLIYKIVLNFKCIKTENDDQKLGRYCEECNYNNRGENISFDLNPKMVKFILNDINEEILAYNKYSEERKLKTNSSIESKPSTSKQSQ